MTREEMWKEFENQLIRETRTPITVSYDASEKMVKSAIKTTVAKWKERLEQEPRTGHWDAKNNMWWVCSACGCQTRMMKKYNVPNFCPACGADMREV